nr:hypothetical protein [Kibdelosporangium sp. MJ126-NF4]
MRLHIDDTAGTVLATATLTDENDESLSASGQFRPADTTTSGSRYELAAARALQRLSDALIIAADRSA